MPEPADHAEKRGKIETILRQIPGFRGYLDKEDRRQSDQLQRRWLADRLQRSKRSMDQLARSLADAGQIDVLPELDRVRGRLDKLIARIRGAMQGYSGFFDLVQVDAALLDRIYSFDVTLLEQVDGLSAAVEQLPGQQSGAADALGRLADQIDRVERQWDLREDMLKGLE
jgi:hypothetical protein